MRDVFIEARGDYKNKREQVKPGLPTVCGDGKDLEDSPHAPSHRRKDCALWLTRPDHPRTARVMVNRIWQGHFGSGLVRTPNDFGRQGEAPSHPELLDWLATEFVRQKWSVKQMHRLMLSQTYRQSNQYDEANARVDGENLLLWRMNRHRLEAEAVRDAVLTVAGNLNPKMNGVRLAHAIHLRQHAAHTARFAQPRHGFGGFLDLQELPDQRTAFVANPGRSLQHTQPCEPRLAGCELHVERLRHDHQRRSLAA